MPFGLVASFNLVFIAFVDLGPVGRPAVKAEQPVARAIKKDRLVLFVVRKVRESID